MSSIYYLQFYHGTNLILPTYLSNTQRRQNFSTLTLIATFEPKLNTIFSHFLKKVNLSMSNSFDKYLGYLVYTHDLVYTPTLETYSHTTHHKQYRTTSVQLSVHTNFLLNLISSSLSSNSFSTSCKFDLYLPYIYILRFIFRFFFSVCIVRFVSFLKS